MARADRPALPLVYACSGSSSAAQLANHVAVRLDRTGLAEMSCIAGVGGDVPQLLKTAQSGRQIVVLDGCPLECARHCLQRHGIAPTQHHQLQIYGVRRRLHEDFDPEQAEAVLFRVRSDLQKLPPPAPAPDEPAQP
ncbi:putative zinc-binding protein [Hydrogenophaga sp.]|uniref:putative zinc-binding protein n=1 Tax=Hydrogenophaga sp. TaxID=1904254 RepID=UPI00286E04DF|nr:putative zinc-binding protein [Hydrogenophaga sp.]